MWLVFAVDYVLFVVTLFFNPHPFSFSFLFITIIMFGCELDLVFAANNELFAVSIFPLPLLP